LGSVDHAQNYPFLVGRFTGKAVVLCSIRQAV